MSLQRELSLQSTSFGYNCLGKSKYVVSPGAIDKLRESSNENFTAQSARYAYSKRDILFVTEQTLCGFDRSLTYKRN